ncbi:MULTISPECIES: hypothetical protein [unclassified Janthinobacterium]|uniref:hypothetical protein n=1 Tax=unclassified Janthinobacterium TaxID=2610881 RepID=UPI0018DC1C6B|nr:MULTISPECIES: hypothetical protein [unclassified Janthinobacterium]MDN2710332.1 hypothetical protein [Janthinobacterium sp. SUN118]
MTTCDECGSAYRGAASAMASLCPACAHALYGYPRCEHEFEAGHCRKCLWDGKTSDFVRKLASR